jgi:hypothetical protein
MQIYSLSGALLGIKWVSDRCLMSKEQFLSYIMMRTRYIWWEDNDVLFVLDQHAEFDFYSASSLKQKSTGRSVASLWHIILIPRQQAFALSPYSCVLSREATYTNLTVLGLIWTWFDPTIYCTLCKHVNHYTTNAATEQEQKYWHIQCGFQSF